MQTTLLRETIPLNKTRTSFREYSERFLQTSVCDTPLAVGPYAMGLLEGLPLRRFNSIKERRIA